MGVFDFLRRTVVAAAFAASSCVSAPTDNDAALEAAGERYAVARPLIIAHRGASGERPEHTLEAYALAIAQGADIIEPDLVMTIDGVLVARHERYLSVSTDVADRPEFADRRRPDPSGLTDKVDWWVETFTLAEIKTLRARQTRPGRSTDLDGQFEIPTFDEVTALAAAEGERLGRVIPVYPEAKDPAAFFAAGLDMLAAFETALSARGWTTADAPVFVQCFDPEFLGELRPRTGVLLVQLIEEETWLPVVAAGEDGATIDAIATYADGLGPQKTLIADPDGRPSDLMRAAKARGLFVHPWTYRDDAPPPSGQPIEAELEAAFGLGVDAVFTDFPATAVRVRDRIAGPAA